MKPQALDLFCKAGGAARGLATAGFDVTGVDIAPQPNYPYEFLNADALSGDGHPNWLEWLRTFDFIWASPPCLANTALRHAKNGKKHPDLIAPTRALLQASGVPYVIENVEGAKELRPTLKLCGSMFSLGVFHYQLRRHRLFECSFSVPQPECSHTSPTIGVYGGHVRCRSAAHGGRRTRDFEGENKDFMASTALGLDCASMTMDEYSNAIPPAYACYIATHFLAGRK